MACEAFSSDSNEAPPVSMVTSLNAQISDEDYRDDQVHIMVVFMINVFMVEVKLFPK